MLLIASIFLALVWLLNVHHMVNIVRVGVRWVHLRLDYLHMLQLCGTLRWFKFGHTTESLMNVAL